MSTLNDPNFVVLNGFDEMDVYMSDEQSYGANSAYFHHHQT